MSDQQEPKKLAVEPKKVPIIETKPILERPVKCCECSAMHKMRNVVNGQKYCSSCFQRIYGVRKRVSSNKRKK